MFGGVERGKSTVRKLSGMLLVMLFVLLLAACGAGDEEPEPTEEATEPPAVTETVETEPTEEPPGMEVASPAATPMADASPTSAVVPVDEASGATPDSVGTPVAAATPVGTPVTVTGFEAGEEDASMMIPLSGQVVLTGAENEAFVISDEGCVGLGEHSDMQVGRQVVVRDESGTIAGVTTLEASDAEGCAWTFSLEVPESEFYSVAVPMKTEMVFTQQEVADANGELAVPLP